MVFGEKKNPNSLRMEARKKKKRFNLASGWALVAMETQLWIE